MSHQTDDAMRVAFCHWFGLAPAAAALLVRLFNLKGVHLSAHNGVAGSQSTPASVAYHIYNLRQALETEAIDYVPRTGYALTEVGLAECRAVLRRVGEEMLTEAA